MMERERKREGERVAGLKGVGLERVGQKGAGLQSEHSQGVRGDDIRAMTVQH